MLYVLPGLIAFLLFYLYEIYSATGRFRILKPAFFLGVLLISLSTGGAVLAALPSAQPRPLFRLVFGGVALLFLGLLLYALFFAVPFSKTYVESAQQRKKVCRTGMYALCRHPGVLWFIGFYLFLWLALGGTPLLAQLICYSVLNFIYIVLQDRWSFLLCFDDYADYQKDVPFLIPSGKSLRLCLASFHLPRGET